MVACLRFFIIFEKTNPMKNLILFLSILSLSIVSCTKEPTASFDSVSTVEEGIAIQFTNTSEDSESQNWDFGDGTTSTDLSPSKSFIKKGTYTVTLTAFSKKEKKKSTATKTISITKPAERIEGTIDGSQVSIVLDVNGGESSNSKQSSINCDAGNPSASTIIYGFNMGNGGTQSFMLDKGKLNLGFCENTPSDATFLSFFTTGTYTFSKNAENGFELGWNDGTQLWSTSKGSADQTGSSIKITQTGSEEIWGEFYVNVNGTFNCKLYNDAGASKTLTNGKFIGYFEK